MNREKYTLITGAGTGFGKALALECARLGHPLVLVSLPGPELSCLADFIRKNHQVPVISVETDLSEEGNCIALYNRIRNAGIRINVLINNAGIGGTDRFEKKAMSFYKKQLQVNVLAPTFLSYLFLDELKSNSPSHILNVSSMAGFFCVPQKQVYGGSKSYLLSFSGSLALELKKQNISVSVVCPGAMNTTDSLTWQNKKASHILKWSVMNPERVASIALKKMFAKRKVIIPGFWNNVICLLHRLLPEWFRVVLMEQQLKRIERKQDPQKQGLAGTVSIAA